MWVGSETKNIMYTISHYVKLNSCFPLCVNVEINNFSHLSIPLYFTTILQQPGLIVNLHIRRIEGVSYLTSVVTQTHCTDLQVTPKSGVAQRTFLFTLKSKESFETTFRPCVTQPWNFKVPEVDVDFFTYFQRAGSGEKSKVQQYQCCFFMSPTLVNRGGRSGNTWSIWSLRASRVRVRVVA